MITCSHPLKIHIWNAHPKFIILTTLYKKKKVIRNMQNALILYSTTIWSGFTTFVCYKIVLTFCSVMTTSSAPATFGTLRTMESLGLCLLFFWGSIWHLYLLQHVLDEMVESMLRIKKTSSNIAHFGLYEVNDICHLPIPQMYNFYWCQ